MTDHNCAHTPHDFLSHDAADSSEPINRQMRLFRASHMQSLVDAMPSLILVLNDDLRIVSANAKMINLFGHGARDSFLGSRTGEALGCLNAVSSPAGCTGAEGCAYCGARQALLEEGETSPEGRDYRLTVLRDGFACPLDFRVWIKRITIEGARLTLMTMLDVSHEKRLRAMERIFFHDVLGGASGIGGLLSFLREDLPPALREQGEIIAQAFDQHVELIQAQKDLLAAESDELAVRWSCVNVRSIMEDAAALARGLSTGRKVNVGESPGRLNVTSDRVLLRRILDNMLKNAVEASGRGQNISIDCHDEDDQVLFCVRNPTAMSQEAKAQVFSRSFSTKGIGRGLGTWSMKLLGERYLGGRVFFTSNEQEGTCFYLRLPKEPRTV